MLIKTVLCVALLIFTSGIGYSFALKYRKRKLFYSQFYEFNEKFLQELGYTKRPLAEFIKNTAYKGDFSELLRLFLEGSFKETNFESYFASITFLKNEEEKEITQFFAELGKGDCESQKKIFSNRLNLLLKKKTETDTDYKKYAELYVKLGVLVGLSIIIMLL